MNIFITGASRGLGLSLVEHGLAKGHRIAAAVRDPDSLSVRFQELERSYPDKLLIVRMEVKDEDSVRAASEQVRKQWGTVDALVNNAAVLLGREQLLENLSLADMEETFQINLYGPVRVCKHFLPLISASGDKVIVNISSEAGSFANAYGGDYSYALSKGALNLFSEHLRRYTTGRGIRVYAVHPGWIRTDMGGAAAPGDPAESAKGILALIEGEVMAGNVGVFIDHRGEPMAF
ncbi:SDR family oxidoreductase [Gorillibacterium massiliense]|uniref:SDR family oxidoreductase n=1 Tax=Gorillibacterium massiliense TaxID=1280390 RepID=UPI0004B3B413|nr:SDR family oxidoreductase [Gorillibacterium massiliense]